jgi:hypothetical protein
MTNPLGWSMLAQTVVQRERWPGGKAKYIPLVYPGQEVRPDQPVMRIEREQAVEAVQAGSRLSLLAASGQLDVKAVHEGLKVQGEAEVVPSGLQGRVVDITRRGGVVIESRAAVIQGTIGTGYQVAGVLTMWQASNTSPGPQTIPPGAILVVPGPLTFTMLRQALTAGIVGVIASSITAGDFEGFLHTDLIRLINSEDAEQAQAHLPPLTVLLTEGLGSVSMPARIINLLSQYQGGLALLSGTTSVRQGIFPELIISLPAKETQHWQPVQPDPKLVLGAYVRVCSGEREGATGTIDYLFVYEQEFSGGIHARAVRLRLEDGSKMVVPITLVERIS